MMFEKMQGDNQLNELDDKGKLIYQMPNEIHQKNRKDLIIAYFLLPIFFFIIFLATISFVRNMFDVGAFILLVAFFIIFIMLGIINDARINRFEIYEKGYFPAVKPIEHHIKKEEYFIFFNDIKKIEYKAWGGACDLTLKNGDEVTVSAGWGDIDGYIEFSRVIKKYFPKTKIPNLEIVKKRFIAWESYLDKKISKKEHDEISNEMMALNKEFMKPKLLN
jgi:cell division protein FtsW (lipid II flippase)